MTFFLKKICVILSCLIFFVQNPAFAQDAGLSGIKLANTDKYLLLSLNVENAFREKIHKAVLSGVPTSFSFIFTVYRIRGLWLNKKVSEKIVTHTIKYNNIKKEFTISRSWENNKPMVTMSFEKARKLMTEVEGLRIAGLDRLEKGKQYQIRAKAELSKMTLPFYLHYVLFFVSLWDFETDWHTINFTH